MLESSFIFQEMIIVPGLCSIHVFGLGMLLSHVCHSALFSIFIKDETFRQLYEGDGEQMFGRKQ